MAGRKSNNSNKTTSRKSALGGAKALERRGFAKFSYNFLVVVVWFFILLVPVVFYYAHDLPDISSLKLAQGRSTVMIMDRDGKPLASYGDVYGEWLEFDDIPVEHIQAVIATEDRRFFDHNGIDLRGFTRAIVRNVTSGNLVQGGSTITQQLAKNLFLSSAKTLKRKIQELLLAFWLEINFDKQELLTLYLNRVYFGSGTYGIDAAARTCFGHGAKTLSLTEGAMLAGMLKGPALYSPLRDVERSYARTGEVLDNMVEAGFIQTETATIAKGRNVSLVEDNAGGDVRYFTDWVVEQVAELVGPRQDPLIVYTTLVGDMQHMAAGAVGQVLEREGERYQASQGAIVSMDLDGAIRALIGGRDYGKSQFNRATQAKRQPGSAFKLFIYLSALEAGLGPDTVMRDSPVILNGWEPKNYSGKYRGPVTLRTAFAQSLNTVAVKLTERVDRGHVIEMARRLGLTTRLVREPSLSLGTSEVYLIELTAAYATVANGGYGVKPYGIVEIHSSAGQILYRHMPGPPVRILEEKVAATMQDMLRGVVTGGTARAARMNFPVGGKTGTTQNNKDALFVGYGLDMINGVWVGNDDATSTKGVTGGGTPARIWKNFMLRVSLGRNDATLITPNITPRTKPKP